MRSFSTALVKIAISIALLAIAFWPQYGAAYYIYDHFGAMPALWSALIALWVGALALNLPLSLNWFRKVTTGSLVVLFGAGIYTLEARGYFAAEDLNSWIITMIFLIGLVIGWWTVSVPLWRWYRKTMPTDEIEVGEAE